MFLLYLRIQKYYKNCLVWLKLWNSLFVLSTEWPLSDDQLSSYGQNHLLDQIGEQLNKMKPKKNVKVNIDGKLGSWGKPFKKEGKNFTQWLNIFYLIHQIFHFFTIVKDAILKMNFLLKSIKVLSMTFQTVLTIYLQMYKSGQKKLRHRVLSRINDVSG